MKIYPNEASKDKSDMGSRINKVLQAGAVIACIIIVILYFS
jgi:hypothetical protein